MSNRKRRLVLLDLLLIGLGPIVVWSQPAEEAPASNDFKIVVPPQADDVLDRLSPEQIHRVSGAVKITPSSADLTVLRSCELSNFGYAIEPGQGLYVGDVVLRGLLRNAEAQSAYVLVLNGAGHDVQRLRLPPGDVVIIGCLTSCSVSCTSPAYACCHDQDGCAVCGCITPNGGPTVTCDAGGSGSSACSATVPEKDE